MGLEVIFGKCGKTDMLCFWIIFWLLFGGAIIELLPNGDSQYLHVRENDLTLIFLFFICSGTVAIFKIPFQKRTVVKFLSRPLALLLVYQLIVLGLNGLHSAEQKIGKPVQAAGNARPILHVMLDGYGRSDVLKEYYELDNSEFLSALKNIGFEINSKARSNYSTTVQSLSSMFLMEYISEARSTIQNHLANPLGITLLRKAGYRIEATDPGVPFVSMEPFVDHYYRFVDSENEIVNLITRGSIILPVARLFNPDLPTLV